MTTAVGAIVPEGVGCGVDVSFGSGTSVGVCGGVVANVTVGTRVGVIPGLSTVVGLGSDVSATISLTVGAATGTVAGSLPAGGRAGSEVEGFPGAGVKVGTAQAIDTAETKIVSTLNFNDMTPGRSFPMESFRALEKSLMCFRIQTKNSVNY